MGFLDSASASIRPNSELQNLLDDRKDLLNVLDSFKNTLSSSEQALFGDLFDDFAKHFGSGGGLAAFKSQHLNSADELMSLFSGLKEIPDLFQGRIPSGLDSVGKLEFIRDNLSPRYEAFAGTIDELIDKLKSPKFNDAQFDSDLSDMISLIGNRDKMAAPPPDMAGPEPGAPAGMPASSTNAGGPAGAPPMSGAAPAEGEGQGGADIGQEIAKTQSENLRNTASAKKSSNRSDSGSQSEGSIDGARGGSIFEAIALALGEAMTNKLQGLLEAAEGVRSSDEDILEKSAQVTARGQELNAVSQAFNSSINSVGQAASTAGRKT